MKTRWQQGEAASSTDSTAKSRWSKHRCWVALLALPALACSGETVEEVDEVGTASQQLGLSWLPNLFPIPNSGGIAATYSTQGYVDLTSEYATPQGTNGRDCTTCHAVQDGWALTATTAKVLFELTDGLHPLFNVKDADNPETADLSSEQSRRNSFTMLRQGKFVRTRAIPGGAEFECIAFDDPFGYGHCNRIHNFRTSMATQAFRSVTVSWDAGNTRATLREGLENQAGSNVTGAQEGDPATEEVIDGIVDFELALSHAQLWVPGVGLLNGGGAKGGPEALSEQELEEGRFDLYDAWEHSSVAKRRQIWRGQELFNNGDANGRRCGGCHNASNSGENVSGALFDVGASRVEFAKDDMAIYTFRNIDTGEERSSTDIGRALRTGRWSDMDRFKTPTLRGLAARPPYFHNGIAATLEDVVDHYEVALGFDFTKQEEKDLVAFLNAL